MKSQLLGGNTPPSDSEIESLLFERMVNQVVKQN